MAASGSRGEAYRRVQAGQAARRARRRALSSTGWPKVTALRAFCILIFRDRWHAIRSITPGHARAELAPLLVSLFPTAERRVALSVATVDEMIDALDARWPGMRDRICDSTPAIRLHMNVFVNDVQRRIRGGSFRRHEPAERGAPRLRRGGSFPLRGQALRPPCCSAPRWTPCSKAGCRSSRIVMQLSWPWPQRPPTGTSGKADFRAAIAEAKRGENPHRAGKACTTSPTLSRAGTKPSSHLWTMRVAFQSHYGAELPGDELVVAQAVPFTAARGARGRFEHQPEEVRARLGDGLGSVDDAAGIEVHVEAHASVERAVGGDLQRWRRLAAIGGAAPRGEADEVRPAHNLTRGRHWIVAGRIHEYEAFCCHLLSIFVDRHQASATSFGDRAERFFQYRRDAARLVAGGGVVVHVPLVERRILLPPLDAGEQSLADRVGSSAGGQKVLGAIDFRCLGQNRRAAVAHKEVGGRPSTGLALIPE